MPPHLASTKEGIHQVVNQVRRTHHLRMAVVGHLLDGVDGAVGEIILFERADESWIGFTIGSLVVVDLRPAVSVRGSLRVSRGVAKGSLRTAW